MLAVVLTFGVLFSLMFFITGGMIGWLVKEHLYNNQPQVVYGHPEMFDEHGNILPDDILAVRFENNYDNNDEEE